MISSLICSLVFQVDAKEAVIKVEKQKLAEERARLAGIEQVRCALFVTTIPRSFTA